MKVIPEYIVRTRLDIYCFMSHDKDKQTKKKYNIENYE